MWGSRTWILFGFCVVVAGAGLRIAAHKAEPPPFEARVYASTDGTHMGYRLYVPPNYDPHKKYPLVIWLHGSDAVGNDNLAQITGYNDAGTRVWTTPEHWKKLPALVVAPQSYERYWSMLPSPLPAEEPQVLEIVAAIEKEFSIDSDRVYLAGQSMGGFGVWAFLEHRPDLYAAGIIVCGPVNREMQSQATRIAHIPVWVFQGGKDDVVSIEDARAMVDLLRKAGGQPHYTEYPSLGHLIGSKVFTEKSLLPWLFDQRRTIRDETPRISPSH